MITEFATCTGLPSAVVIVNPMAAGYVLRETVRYMGLAVIALFTVPKQSLVEHCSSFVPDISVLLRPGPNPDFDLVVFQTEFARMVAALRAAPFRIKAVIAGSEPGVDFADKIGFEFGVPHNDPSTLAARRDKALMKECARAAGLRHARFQRCYLLEDALAFASEVGFPVVAKIPNGCATHLVFHCEDERSLAQAFREVFEGENFFGQKPEFVLLEEFIEGGEYIVNLFGTGAGLIVTDVWEYVKCDFHGAHNLYYTQLQIPATDPAAEALRPYAVALGEALGIHIGPIHAEIKLDDEGPIMIEVASRFCGSNIVKFVSDNSNFDAFSTTVDVFTSGKVPMPAPIRINSRLAVVDFPIPRGGIVERYEGLESIQALESYCTHRLNFPVNSMIPATTDLINEPMKVWMKNRDAIRLQADIDAAHELFSVRFRNEPQAIGCIRPMTVRDGLIRP